MKFATTFVAASLAVVQLASAAVIEPVPALLARQSTDDVNHPDSTDCLEAIKYQGYRPDFQEMGTTLLLVSLPI